jgi:predicted nucleic acid-binding protein
MKYLLDTNVISEPMKAHPNGGLVAWLSGLNEDEACISVVTIS